MFELLVLAIDVAVSIGIGTHLKIQNPVAARTLANCPISDGYLFLLIVDFGRSNHMKSYTYEHGLYYRRPPPGCLYMETDTIV